MDCTAIADRVAGYLDGELARSERVLYEAHLESCEACCKLVERVSAVDLSPPPMVAATSQPEFWAPMDAALGREQDAAQVAAAAEEPVRPRGLRGLARRELRVGLPVVLGYALLLILSVSWALANLNRAWHAEYASSDLAQQLEREQRQIQTPEAVVPQSKVGEAAARMHHKF